MRNTERKERLIDCALRARREAEEKTRRLAEDEACGEGSPGVSFSMWDDEDLREWFMPLEMTNARSENCLSFVLALQFLVCGLIFSN